MRDFFLRAYSTSDSLRMHLVWRQWYEGHRKKCSEIIKFITKKNLLREAQNDTNTLRKLYKSNRWIKCIHKLNLVGRRRRNCIERELERERKKKAHAGRNPVSSCASDRRKQKERMNGWGLEKKKRNIWRGLQFYFRSFLFHRHLNAAAPAAATFKTISKNQKQRGCEKKNEIKLRCRPLTSHECKRIESISTEHAQVRFTAFAVSKALEWRKKSLHSPVHQTRKLFQFRMNYLQIKCTRDVSHAFTLVRWCHLECQSTNDSTKMVSTQTSAH